MRTEKKSAPRSPVAGKTTVVGCLGMGVKLSASKGTSLLCSIGFVILRLDFFSGSLCGG